MILGTFKAIAKQRQAAGHQSHLTLSALAWLVLVLSISRPTILSGGSISDNEVQEVHVRLCAEVKLPRCAKQEGSSGHRAPTVLEAKRDFRKQQQQQQRQAQEQGRGQAPPAGRPQPWQQADGAGRGLRLPPLPEAAPPAAPSAPQERVIETRRRSVLCLADAVHHCHLPLPSTLMAIGLSWLIFTCDPRV